MRVDSIFGGPPGGEEDEEEGVGAAAAAVLSEAPAEAATWIAVRMTDNSGDPVKSLRYEIKLPNGDVRKGTLDDNGLARLESPTSGECTVTFPDLDASDWDAGAAAAATAATTTPPQGAKRSYFGTLQGPSGPLVQWPFVLERGGQPLDDAALNGGRASNEYRDGYWYSDAKGAFRFDDLPEGDYTIEVVSMDGELVPNDAPAPEGAEESGDRAPLPEPLDPTAFTEDPQEPVLEQEG